MDRNRLLREAIRHCEFRPCISCVGAERATLHAGALAHRQPHRAIGSYMQVTVQATAGRAAGHARALAIVSWDPWTVARTEIVAPLAGRRTNNILRTVVDCAPFVRCIVT